MWRIQKLRRATLGENLGADKAAQAKAAGNEGQGSLRGGGSF
jgi:hypothetical protein